MSGHFYISRNLRSQSEFVEFFKECASLKREGKRMKKVLWGCGEGLMATRRRQFAVKQSDPVAMHHPVSAPTIYILSLIHISTRKPHFLPFSPHIVGPCGASHHPRKSPIIYTLYGCIYMPIDHSFFTVKTGDFSNAATSRCTYSVHNLVFSFPEYTSLDGWRFQNSILDRTNMRNGK